MKEKILEAYSNYANENHDLAISITARHLNIDESEVRNVIEA